MRRDVGERNLEVVADGRPLPGILRVPPSARGLVVFAHGSGSSRLSPRNRQVADALNEVGLATYLTDLLLPWEAEDRRLVFDVCLLGDRLLAATAGARAEGGLGELPLGYFGASTGAAAALVAAAVPAAATDLDLPEAKEPPDGPRGVASHPRDRETVPGPRTGGIPPGLVRAIVSRGGRTDLAMPVLGGIQAATLLIVGGRDETVLRLNEQALEALHCERRLEVVPGASHLFEEPGALERVAELAATWFVAHLDRRGAGSSGS